MAQKKKINSGKKKITSVKKKTVSRKKKSNCQKKMAKFNKSVRKFLKRNDVMSTLLIINMLLIGGIIVMTVGMSDSINVQKSAEWQPVDGPTANAFIMSYCPYGLQFLKAYVPVIELLGDKANVMVNFVSYIMHGETEILENSRMYCIQYEQNDKFTDYLRCFVEAGDFTGCIESVGIDTKKLDTCMENLDTEYSISELFADKETWSNGRYPQYPVEASLNAQYSVGGSPSFILEDQQVQVARSPESIKQAICNAFDMMPEECNTILSSVAELPSFGPIGAGQEGAAASDDLSC